MSYDKKIITKTNDGYVVEIFANSKKYIEKGIEEIAEGLTLLEPQVDKTEEEQFSIYKEMVEKMDEAPVIVKALDIENKNLKEQLRAMLRVAKHGDLSIAFPKISTITELREYNDILEECKTELEQKEIPYKKHIKTGIIVEIPSAALMAYELARECDFFCIETNSLTKYAFGNKTNNKEIPNLYEKFQPAVIQLVQHAIEGAHDAGIFCGICGEVVENELYMPILMGLGLDEFSMDSNKILKARKLINELDKSDCKELVEEVLQLRTLEDIERKLKQLKKD